MKKLLAVAATLVLGMTFAPAAQAATTPSPDPLSDSAGTSMQHVPLDAMPSGASDKVEVPENYEGAGPSTSELGTDGSAVEAPAGPEVIYNQAPAGVANAEPQVKANNMPQAPANATNKAPSSISVINANSPRSFVASPIDSIPGVISFLFIMALCVGAGVVAALIISAVTGKKINFGLSSR